MEKIGKTRGLIAGLGAALAIIMLVRIFAVEALVIDGNSMAPTIVHGDVVLVNKLAYGLPNPMGGYLIRWAPVVSGDLVVFTAPDGRLAVKRCHATWADKDSEYPAWAPGTIVALGDNPEESWDSRSYGPIEENSIVGRVAGYR